MFLHQGYKVRVDNKPDVDTYAKHAVVCNLTPGTKYDIYVLAYSQVGAGPEAKITLSTQFTSELIYKVTMQWHSFPLSKSRSTLSSRSRSEHFVFTRLTDNSVTE